jgi:hypothetical protein
VLLQQHLGTDIPVFTYFVQISRLLWDLFAEKNFTFIVLCLSALISFNEDAWAMQLFILFCNKQGVFNE